MTEPQPPKDPAAEAEAAFASFLALRAQGQSVDFDAWCRERPELAAWLRQLHQWWMAQKGEPPPRPVSALLAAHDPTISLDPPPPVEPDVALRERLRSLSERLPKTPRYALQGEVARGGMGAILRVWDQDLRRTLAMKVILSRDEGRVVAGETPLVDPQYLSRFLEEAQITGQLDHPGVVPVHELGVDGEGRVFFTMRMVKGRNLEEIFRLARAREDGWTLPRAVSVILKVCEAMGYAHSKGVVHRDLKPSNVMVGKFGETYVMDWGLAKVIGRPDPHDLRIKKDTSSISLLHVRTDRHEDAARTPHSPLMTMDGTIVGTPSYMSPEQAEGRLDEVGPRSDVYSGGALLYTLLSGSTPYLESARMTPYEVLHRLLAGPPVPILDLEPAAPAELVAICEKAMARDAAARYAGMMDLAEDLRAWLEGRVVRAFEQGAWAEFRKWVTRNRPTAAALAAAILVLITGIGLLAWLQSQKVRDVTKAERETSAARDRAVANEGTARRQGYVANLVAADASLRMLDAPGAKRRLAASEEKLRGWEWRHLRALSDTSLKVLLGHMGRVTGVAFAPGGGRLVSGAEGGRLRVWDAGTGEPLFELPGTTDAVTAVAWSPEGGRIAAASVDGVVRVFDGNSARQVATLSGHEGAVLALAFDSTGRQLFTGSSDQTARLWDATNGNRIAALDGLEVPVQAVAVGPGGRLLAVATEGTVRLYAGATRAEVRRLEGHGAPVSSVAFSPDGERIATGSFDNMVRLWATGRVEPPVVLQGHADPVTSVSWNRDGTRLASSSFDGTVRVWDGATGAQRAQHLGHEGPVLTVAFGPDDGVIVSGAADGTVRLWPSGEAEAARTLRVEGELISSVAFSPDGALLAAGSGSSGTVRVWEGTTLRPARELRGEGGGVNAVAFSPDGAWIAAGSDEDSKARIWDAATGALVRALEGHEASITSMAFGTGRAQLATGSADNTVRLWDAEAGTARLTLRGHEQRVSALAFAPGGARLASASFDKTVRLWDPTTSAQLRKLEGHGEPVHSLAFHPRKPRLASGGADGSIRVWDVETGAPLVVLEGHVGPVHALAFSPDGTRLVSGGRDKTVRVWDADGGELLVTFRSRDGWVTSVAWSPDGTRLAAGHFDGTVVVRK
jgi:WD40 repeat protein/serine/threonine protein kinase